MRHDFTDWLFFCLGVIYVAFCCFAAIKNGEKAMTYEEAYELALSMFDRNRRTVHVVSLNDTDDGFAVSTNPYSRTQRIVLTMSASEPLSFDENIKDNRVRRTAKILKFRPRNNVYK